MANQTYQRASGKGKFGYFGINLRTPPDLMPQGRAPFLLNVTPDQRRGVMQARAGLTTAGTTGVASPVHSLQRVNNNLPGATNAWARFVGVGTGLQYAPASTPTTYTSLTGTFSGNPLAMVPYRPPMSPETWLYVYDSIKQAKYRTDGTAYNLGILPPVKEPTSALATPNLKVVTDPTSTTGWTTSGNFGAVSFASRVTASTTISKIVYDSGTTGWCSVVPTNASSNFSAFTLGTRVILNAETVTIYQIFGSIASTTVRSISYDSGTTGLCTIQSQLPIQGLQRNMLLVIGTQNIRVLAVTQGPDGLYSFRCSTGTNVAGGAAITAPISFRCFTTGTHAAAEAITGGALSATISAAAGGSGILSATSALDLSQANSVPLLAEDYMHISLLVDNPNNLQEIHVLLDVDSTTNDFNHNFYYYVVRQSDYQSVASGTATTVTSQLNALQNSIANQTLFGEISQKLLPYPAAGLLVTGEPAAGQFSSGSSQWFDAIFKISDLVRVGTDQTVGLNLVKAIGINVISSGPLTASVTSWWVGGGAGPDANFNSYGNQGIPIRYRYRYRSSVTGAVSDVSPATRYGELPWRMGVSVGLTASTDAQVDLIDIERNGGTFDTWHRFMTVPNTTGNISDIVTETIAMAGDPLELLMYAPWPITDKVRRGTCNIVGTSVIWVSGDTFNVNWIRGVEFIVNNQTYTLFAPPSSTTRLQTAENIGVLSGVSFLIPEATICASPLPYACLGPDGRVFACGDQYNPGFLYFSQPYNPDAASDQGYIEVTGPSEPIYAPVYWEGTLFVFSNTNVYRVESTPGQANPYAAYKMGAISSGLAAPWAISADGPVLAWLGNDGIYGMGAGGAATVMTEELEPLFPFESRPGLPVAVAGYTLYPPDYTQQALLRLSFAYGVYFFDYQDTQAVQRTLTFDPDTKGWVPYNYSPGISLHYEEEGNANPQTICGATDGTLYTVSSAQSDNNVAFSCVVVTPSDDQGETRARKQYGDLMLDYSLATAPVPVVPYIPGISGYSPGYIPVGGGPSYSPQNGLYYYGTASDNNITRTVQVTAGNMFDINQGNSFTAYYLVVQVYLALGQGSGGIVTITGTGFSVSIPFSANLPDPTRPGNYYCTPIIYALGTAKLLPANSNLTFLLTGLHDPSGFGFGTACEITNAPVLMGNSGVFV